MATHGNLSAEVIGRKISGMQGRGVSLAVVAETAAEKIRDDLVEQEVLYRRVDASVRREVDARLDQMGRDLKDLMLKIDVAGTKRSDARRRRLKKLNTESRIVIRTAYSEVGGILRSAVRRIAKAETKNTAKIMRRNIP